MRAYEGKIDFWLRSDSLGRAFCFTRVPRPWPRAPYALKGHARDKGK